MRTSRIVLLSVAVVLLLLLLNARWVNTRTRAAEARDGGQLIETDVVTANVRITGDGPPIVLIHGFSAAIDWWDAITPDLARDHKVIAIDLIGHGGTAAPPSGYTIERQAALIAAVLDKLGVGRVTVIGHSMGGEVATAFAELNPGRVERIILIDSPPNSTTDFTLLTKLYLNPLIGPMLSHFRGDRIVRRGLAQGFAPNYPISKSFVDDFRQLTYTAFRSAHDDSITYRDATPPYKRLEALRPVPPLLVIFGREDAIVPAANAKLFEQVPRARVATIDDAGHSPMVETPAKTLESIRGFLADKPR